MRVLLLVLRWLYDNSPWLLACLVFFTAGSFFGVWFLGESLMRGLEAALDARSNR